MDSGQPLLNIKKLLKTPKPSGDTEQWKTVKLEGQKKKEAVGEQEAETATELMIEK